MKAPPPRYQVIERGRRLIVIDRRTGEPASRPPRSGPRSDGAKTGQPRRSLPSLPVRTRFDGGATLTTHPLYDEKAPRTIRLDPGSAASLGRVRIIALCLAVMVVVAIVAQPALIVLAAVLAGKPVRAAIRRHATRWLDRVEAEAS